MLRSIEPNHPAEDSQHHLSTLPPCRTSLEWLQRAHTEQLALCAQLEDIADSLPANVDPQKCLYAARALNPLIKGVHNYEEKILFPWLENISDIQPALRETLNRLKFEHCEDACFAEELTDTLLRLGSGETVNMEATGYMLRGFFEALRRHIAFEREHILSNLQARVHQ
ncbi:hemerythrin-like domain-containing protein [Agrobacterium vitis]|nr:hemerythrin-like domain-containing protein [Agrobacterium vitis]MBE1438389.1 hemerythrin-like domain-containing protein [Agrobacterium vitis]